MKVSFDPKDHDPKNPDPWMALALDTSTFFSQSAKEALLRNNASFSRSAILPFVRPTGRILIAVFKFIRIFVPKWFTSSNLLHATICWGMKNFVSRDANFLILRHFHVGTQVLRFLNDNLADGQLPGHPLEPNSIRSLRDNVFIQHDLNIYNFIIEVNAYLKKHGRQMLPIEHSKINFSALRDIDSQIGELPNKWHNFLDLQSAIEIYTPLFALFLADRDFWRSSNSLQLDETVAAYTAKLFGREYIMSLVNNKHPMVPLTIMEAGFRLMLHGLDAENLYGFITHMRDHKPEALPV